MSRITRGFYRSKCQETTTIPLRRVRRCSDTPFIEPVSVMLGAPGNLRWVGGVSNSAVPRVSKGCSVRRRSCG